MTESLTNALRGRGGLARTSALRTAGFSRRTLDRHIATGAAVRLPRGWLALPDVDRDLVEAAGRGVVLTCITQARRRGLWLLADEEPPHVAAPPHAGRVATSGLHVHWAQPLVARHPDALVDPIENVLCLVACCQPFENALAVWESAFRKKLTTPVEMAEYALPPLARKVLEEADVWSDSGLETFVVPRLRWMKLPLRRQIWIAGHRIDLLIGDRLVLQIDGATHTGAQRDEDIAHDALLRLMGYHVIRVSYTHIVHRWHEVQDTIMRAVAQGLHLPR